MRRCTSGVTSLSGPSRRRNATVMNAGINESPEVINVREQCEFPAWPRRQGSWASCFAIKTRESEEESLRVLDEQ